MKNQYLKAAFPASWSAHASNPYSDGINLARELLKRYTGMRNLTFFLFISNLCWAGPGFFRLDDQSVPKIVSAGAESVFQIFVLDPQAKLTLDLRKDLPRFDEKIKAAELRPPIETILRYQVKYCQDHGDIDSCNIYTDMVQGTAFLLGKGNSLWTDYHVVDEFVGGIAEHFHLPKWIAMMELEHQNLPIFLFDQSGKLVFAAVKGGDHAMVSVMPFKFRLTHSLPKAEYDQSSDFVNITLSRAIASPLKPSDRPIAMGTKVFMLSYPIGTGPFMEKHANPDHVKELFSRSPYPDAPGDQLRVSMGEVIGPEKLLHQPLTEKELLEWKKNSSMMLTGDELDYFQLIATTSDTVFGSSGGPLLNVQGEVVGMNAGGSTIEVPGGRPDILERGIRVGTVLKKLKE